jgi:hypothetical protein
LLDDPAAPAALKADLARVQAAAPAFDVARGLRAFQAAAAPAPSVTGTVAGAALKGALLGLLTVGAATAVSAHGDRGPAPVVAPAASAPAPARVPPEPAAPPPAGRAMPDVPRLRPSPARPSAPPVPPASVDTADPRPGPEDGLAAETANLGRIRALVPSSPAEALALAEEGHRRFGRGQLQDEREVLAIVALFRLGRRDEGRARTERHLAAHPESVFRDRLRKLAGEGSPDP